MTTLVELLLNGISLGFVYALIALSFVVVFRATGAFNFAVVGFVLLGGLLVARLTPEIGFTGALVVSCAVSATLGWVMERTLLSRVQGAERTVAIAILLLGVDAILTAEVHRQMASASILPLDAPWGTFIVRAGDFGMPAARVAAIIIASLALAAFFVALRYTGWGVSMRATSDDPTTAALMGIRIGRVRASAWVIAGIFTTLAAVFFASYPSPGYDVTIGIVALRALPAVMLGGLDSLNGAVVGGLAVGVVESLASGYDSSLTFLGSGFASVAPYALLIVVLLWRPAGLFGSKEIARV